MVWALGVSFEAETLLIGATKDDAVGIADRVAFADNYIAVGVLLCGVDHGLVLLKQIKLYIQLGH